MEKTRKTRIPNFDMVKLGLIGKYLDYVPSADSNSGIKVKVVGKNTIEYNGVEYSCQEFNKKHNTMQRQGTKTREFQASYYFQYNGEKVSDMWREKFGSSKHTFMKNEVINIIEDIEGCSLEKFVDESNKKSKKLYVNNAKKILIKVCESESMQQHNTCWQDMDINIKDYIVRNDFTFIYYFIWKNKNFYRQALTKGNFTDNCAYISPNRDKYIFYMDAKSADNGEPIVNVYAERNKENLIFSMVKIDLTIEQSDSLIKKDKSGFVYMTTNPTLKDGIIKIGLSINWEQRVQGLYCGNTSVALPFEPICVIKVPNMAKAEKFFHNIFSEKRINSSREFFDFKDDINKAKNILIEYAESVNGEIIVK